ncbi:hypothetical protein C5167_034133 [Papaver somniferum]|uniref:Uncharacterized protein n=1 Tax=Papaver somniferum TaxID=3469 RepID=A0A4Y7KDU5_PAPSO|nr:hypothetical protein C5167_034133 [Papaver somniferum]
MELSFTNWSGVEWWLEETGLRFSNYGIGG